LLERYIADKVCEAIELDQFKNTNSLSEFDQENIRNPIIKYSKGRLLENSRFKRPLEISNNSNKIANGQTQNKCNFYNNKEHNCLIERKKKIINEKSN
jgi:hypothetical protein